MTKQIKTAQAWGCVIADDDCGDIVDAIALRMPAGIFKTPVVIVHGLTEAEVHEAAALRSACRELGVDTEEQLKAKMQPDPRVAVLESLYDAVAKWGPDRLNYKPITAAFDLARKQLELIAAKRGEGV